MSLSLETKSYLEKLVEEAISMGRVPPPRIKRPDNKMYAYEAPYYQEKKVKEVCSTFNSEYKIGDIIQIWYDHMVWDSTFGIISKLAEPKEVDVEDDEQGVVEWNGIFEISIIGKSYDIKDRDGVRECRILNTKYNWKKVTFDEIVEFRRKEWQHSLEVSIDNYKVQKREIRKYKQKLNHNERDLRTAIEEAKERLK